MKLANINIVIIQLIKTSQSIVGILKLLYHTASIKFTLEQVTGGNNFIPIVGNNNLPLFSLDLSGGKYANGEILFVPNDNDT